MTMMLDAPATRKEKVMLERKIVAATAEPETTKATTLPVVEQVPTDVVIDSTDLEQSVEVETDTTAEAVTEPSVPADDDVSPVSKPRTVGLPLVAFKPSQKDMSDDDDAVPYAPPMPSNPFFDNYEDEWRNLGVEVDLSVPIKRESLAELEDRLADEVEKRAASAPVREAEERARKEQEAKEKAEAEAKKAKDEAKRLARIESRGSRRMLGNILMGIGTLAVTYGAVITFVPGM